MTAGIETDALVLGGGSWGATLALLLQNNGRSFVYLLVGKKLEKGRSFGHGKTQILVTQLDHLAPRPETGQGQGRIPPGDNH